MSIDYWFPTVVYTEVLKPPAKRERMMLEYEVPPLDFVG